MPGKGSGGAVRGEGVASFIKFALIFQRLWSEAASSAASNYLHFSGSIIHLWKRHYFLRLYEATIELYFFCVNFCNVLYVHQYYELNLLLIYKCYN